MIECGDDQFLPEEIIVLLFEYLNVRGLSKAACCSWTWKAYAETDTHWKNICEGFLKDLQLLLGSSHGLPRWLLEKQSRHTWKVHCMRLASFTLADSHLEPEQVDQSVDMFDHWFGAKRYILLPDLVAGIDEANNNTIVQTLFVRGLHEFSEPLVITRAFDIIGLRSCGSVELQAFASSSDVPMDLGENPNEFLESNSDFESNEDGELDAALFGDEVDGEEGPANSYPKLLYSGSQSMISFKCTPTPILEDSPPQIPVPCWPRQLVPMSVESIRFYGSSCRPKPLANATNGQVLHITNCYFEAEDTGSIFRAEDSSVAFNRCNFVHVQDSSPLIFLRCHLNIGGCMFGSHASSDFQRNFDIRIKDSDAIVASNAFLEGVTLPVECRTSTLQFNSNECDCRFGIDGTAINHLARIAENNIENFDIIYRASQTFADFDEDPENIDTEHLKCVSNELNKAMPLFLQILLTYQDDRSIVLPIVRVLQRLTYDVRAIPLLDSDETIHSLQILMKSFPGDPEIAELVFVVLGNVASDSKFFRDRLHRMVNLQLCVDTLTQCQGNVYVVQSIFGLFWTMSLHEEFISEFLGKSTQGINLLAQFMRKFPEDELLQERFLGTLNNIAFSKVSLSELLITESVLAVVVDTTFRQDRKSPLLNYGFAFLWKLATNESHTSALLKFYIKLFDGLPKSPSSLATFTRALCTFCCGIGPNPGQLHQFLALFDCVLFALRAVEQTDSDDLEQAILSHCNVLDVILRMNSRDLRVALEQSATAWLQFLDHDCEWSRDAPSISFLRECFDIDAGKRGFRPACFKRAAGSHFARICGESCRNDAESFETVLSTTQVSSGQWFYELELVTDDVMQIGWASSESVFSGELGLGVGDEEHSYAIDLARGALWNAGESTPVSAQKWECFSVLGCFIDLDENTIVFTHNFTQVCPPIQTKYFSNAFNADPTYVFAAITLWRGQQFSLIRSNKAHRVSNFRKYKQLHVMQ